jgi:hypothetical protein
MISTISADYLFISEQVSSTCCAEFRKEQAKKIMYISQEPFHEWKVRGICIGREILYVMV